MITLTGAHVVEKIRVLAAEKPDYIYSNPNGSSSCYYVHTVEGAKVGGCIVGSALIALGVHPDALDEWEFNPAEDVLDGLGIPSTREDRTFIHEAQGSQDERQSWGVALNRAANAVDRLNYYGPNG